MFLNLTRCFILTFSQCHLVKGMKLPTKIALIFFNFRAIVYLLDRDVTYLISLNIANLNNRKINGKRYLTLLALGGGVFHVNFVCLLITFLVLG